MLIIYGVIVINTALSCPENLGKDIVSKIEEQFNDMDSVRQTISIFYPNRKKFPPNIEQLYKLSKSIEAEKDPKKSREQVKRIIHLIKNMLLKQVEEKILDSVKLTIKINRYNIVFNTLKNTLRLYINTIAGTGDIFSVAQLVNKAISNFAGIQKIEDQWVKVKTLYEFSQLASTDAIESFVLEPVKSIDSRIKTDYKQFTEAMSNLYPNYEKHTDLKSAVESAKQGEMGRALQILIREMKKELSDQITDVKKYPEDFEFVQKGVREAYVYMIDKATSVNDLLDTMMAARRYIRAMNKLYKYPLAVVKYYGGKFMVSNASTMEAFNAVAKEILDRVEDDTSVSGEAEIVTDEETNSMDDFIYKIKIFCNRTIGLSIYNDPEKFFKDDQTYSAKRNTAKLLVNTIFGRSIEKLFTDNNGNGKNLLHTLEDRLKTIDNSRDLEAFLWDIVIRLDYLYKLSVHLPTHFGVMKSTLRIVTTYEMFKETTDRAKLYLETSFNDISTLVTSNPFPYEASMNEEKFKAFINFFQKMLEKKNIEADDNTKNLFGQFCENLDSKERKDYKDTLFRSMEDFIRLVLRSNLVPDKTVVYFYEKVKRSESITNKLQYMYRALVAAQCMRTILHTELDEGRAGSFMIAFDFAVTYADYYNIEKAVREEGEARRRTNLMLSEARDIYASIDYSNVSSRSDVNEVAKDLGEANDKYLRIKPEILSNLMIALKYANGSNHAWVNVIKFLKMHIDGTSVIPRQFVDILSNKLQNIRSKNDLQKVSSMYRDLVNIFTDAEIINSEGGIDAQISDYYKSVMNSYSIKQARNIVLLMKLRYKKVEDVRWRSTARNLDKLVSDSNLSAKMREKYAGFLKGVNFEDDRFSQSISIATEHVNSYLMIEELKSELVASLNKVKGLSDDAKERYRSDINTTYDELLRDVEKTEDEIQLRTLIDKATKLHLEFIDRITMPDLQENGNGNGNGNGNENGNVPVIDEPQEIDTSFAIINDNKDKLHDNKYLEFLNGDRVNRYSELEQKQAVKKTAILLKARSTLELLSPGLRLEQVTNVGYPIPNVTIYSIRINKKWRLCFMWDSTRGASNVVAVDYH